MAFKRKLSDASPLSASSFGANSTPDAQSPMSLPQHFNNAMDLDMDAPPRSHGWDLTSASRVKGSDWGNRTHKRFRDGRPDERTIHENTVNKLFAAQKRSQWHVSPVPSEIPPAEQPSITISQPQKSTLHSFWTQIPAPPLQAPIFSYQQSQQDASQTPRCDDCDAALQSEANNVDVDIDMDMKETDSNPFACHDCGKSVCSTCAVVSATRHCLQCATRGRNSRRWW